MILNIATRSTFSCHYHYCTFIGSNLAPFPLLLQLPRHNQNQKNNTGLPTTTSTKVITVKSKYLKYDWLIIYGKISWYLQKIIVFDGKLCHTSEWKRLWAQRLTLSDVTENDWFTYFRWCSFFFQLRDLPTLEYLVKFWRPKGKEGGGGGIDFFPHFLDQVTGVLGSRNWKMIKQIIL